MNRSTNFICIFSRYKQTCYLCDSILRQFLILNVKEITQPCVIKLNIYYIQYIYILKTIHKFYDYCDKRSESFPLSLRRKPPYKICAIKPVLFDQCHEAGYENSAARSSPGHQPQWHLLVVATTPRRILKPGLSAFSAIKVLTISVKQSRCKKSFQIASAKEKLVTLDDSFSGVCIYGSFDDKVVL